MTDDCVRLDGGQTLRPDGSVCSVGTESPGTDHLTPRRPSSRNTNTARQFIGDV